MSIKKKFHLILFLFFLFFFMIISVMYWIILNLVDINELGLHLNKIQSEFLKISLNQDLPDFSEKNLAFPLSASSIKKKLNRTHFETFIEIENLEKKNLYKNLISADFLKKIKALQKKKLNDFYQQDFLLFYKKSLLWIYSSLNFDIKNIRSEKILENLREKLIKILYSPKIQDPSAKIKEIESLFSLFQKDFPKEVFLFQEYPKILKDFLKKKNKQSQEIKEFQSNANLFHDQMTQILIQIKNRINTYKDKGFSLFFLLTFFLFFMLFLVSKIFNILFFKNLKTISSLIQSFSKGKANLKKIEGLSKQNEFKPLLNYFNQFIIFLRKIVFRILFLLKKNKRSSSFLKKQIKKTNAIFSVIYKYIKKIKDNSFTLHQQVKGVYYITDEIHFYIQKQIDLTFLQNKKIQNIENHIKNMTPLIYGIAEASQSKLKLIKSFENDIFSFSKEMQINEKIVKNIQKQFKLTETILEWIEQIVNQTDLLTLNMNLQEIKASENKSSLTAFSIEVREFCKMIQSNVQAIFGNIKNLEELIFSFEKQMKKLREIQKNLFREFENLSLDSQNFYKKAQVLLKSGKEININLSSLVLNANDLEKNSKFLTERTQNIVRNMNQLSEISSKHETFSKHLFKSFQDIEKNYSYINKKLLINLQEVNEIHFTIKKFKIDQS